jgi:hypothetical protein
MITPCRTSFDLRESDLDIHCRSLSRRASAGVEIGDGNLYVDLRNGAFMPLF